MLFFFFVIKSEWCCWKACNLPSLSRLRTSVPPQPSYGSCSPTHGKVNKLPSVSQLMNPQQRNTLTPSSMSGGLTDSKCTPLCFSSCLSQAASPNPPQSPRPSWSYCILIKTASQGRQEGDLNTSQLPAVSESFLLKQNVIPVRLSRRTCMMHRVSPLPMCFRCIT